jgi:hypothetical protein
LQYGSFSTAVLLFRVLLGIQTGPEFFVFKTAGRKRDNRAGLGANHQTGWTELVAKMVETIKASHCKSNGHV